MDLALINRRAAKVKFHIDNLYKELRLPVLVDDEICRLIAISTLYGKDVSVWLNGEEKRLSELSLRICMDYQIPNMGDSSEKRRTRGEE